MIGLRIEKNGWGIFRNRDYHLLDEPKLIVNRFKSFPTPNEDKYINRSLQPFEYCAFKENDLTNWILDNEIKQFIKMGYKIYMLELNNPIVGEFQLIYTKRKIVNKIDITEMFL